MSMVLKRIASFGFHGGVVVLAAVLYFFPAVVGATANPWEVWDHSKEKPVSGGYLRTASAQDVGLMNPNHWPVNDWGIISYLFEKLLASDGNYREVPWLLESHEFIDSQTCVFKIRKGIVFTDGTPFNAEALKYQLEWIQNRKTGAWSRAWLSRLKSIDVIDEHTVKFGFSEPWGSFLGIMASVPGFTISPKALQADLSLKKAAKLENSARTARKKAAKAEEKARRAESAGGKKAAKARKKANKLRKKADTLEKKALIAIEETRGLKKSDVNPVGTSRFILEERKPGNYTKLKRNPKWWYGRSVGHPDMPYLAGRIITVIPDPSVQLANFRAGKIDVLYVDKSHYATLIKDPRFDVYVGNLNWNMGLRFNHSKPPFNDIRVRKAVSQAINRYALVNGLEFGMGRVASSFFPDDHWAHNPYLDPVSFNPESARKLLAEAGYADGLTIKGYMGYTPALVNLTEAVKAMLAKVGVNWEVENLSPAAIDDRIKNIEYDLGENIYYYMHEPDLCVTNFYHPDGNWNQGRSSNKKVIDLIDAGRKEVVWAKRKKIYWEIEKALNESYEDIYLWWPMTVTALSKRVGGFVFERGYQEHKEVWGQTHPLWLKNGK
ncbi:MAG: ABC transporter substrate-binding protein [Proteobacteria bacterium]|nr:ABC transporter substrate-binding protein [Pseudomonadota bacterium]